MSYITPHNNNILQYNTFKKIYKGFSISDKSYWSNAHVVSVSEQLKDEKNQKKVATGLLMLSAGLLFLSKGVQKNSKKLLEKLNEHLEYKLNKSFLNNSSSKIPFYEYFIRGINSFINKSESINNLNSLKDILFMKLMYKTTPTKKIHQAITTLFENISRQTIIKSYRNTQRLFNKMYVDFDKLDNYILKNHANEIVEYKGEKLTKRELIKKARSFRLSLKWVVNVFISDDVQQKRFDYIKNATSQLYSKFWNESFEGFWSKDNKFKQKRIWQTFIAADQMKANKTDLAEKAAFARNMLSYTDAEKKIYLSRYIKNLNALIPVKDAQGADIIKKLKWYIKYSSNLIDNKENILHEIERLEQHRVKPEFTKDKNTNISLIKEMLNDNATGEIQDMLDIYQKIAPFELTNSDALNSLKKAISSLDTSINLETGDLFDKVRDLGIGSAPTDVLTIVISSVMILKALAKTKNNNEKDSIILRSGIPIVGSIATTMISATRLLSGAQALVLGIISGMILNRIGAIIDEIKNKSLNNTNSD